MFFQSVLFSNFKPEVTSLPEHSSHWYWEHSHCTFYLFAISDDVTKDMSGRHSCFSPHFPWRAKGIYLHHVPS